MSRTFVTGCSTTDGQTIYTNPVSEKLLAGSDTGSYLALGIKERIGAVVMKVLADGAGVSTRMILLGMARRMAYLIYFAIVGGN